MSLVVIILISHRGIRDRVNKLINVTKYSSLLIIFNNLNKVLTICYSNISAFTIRYIFIYRIFYIIYDNSNAFFYTLCIFIL